MRGSQVLPVGSAGARGLHPRPEQEARTKDAQDASAEEEKRQEHRMGAAVVVMMIILVFVSVFVVLLLMLVFIVVLVVVVLPEGVSGDAEESQRRHEAEETKADQEEAPQPRPGNFARTRRGGNRIRGSFPLGMRMANGVDVAARPAARDHGIGRDDAHHEHEDRRASVVAEVEGRRKQASPDALLVVLLGVLQSGLAFWALDLLDMLVEAKVVLTVVHQRRHVGHALVVVGVRHLRRVGLPHVVGVRLLQRVGLPPVIDEVVLWDLHFGRVEHGILLIHWLRRVGPGAPHDHHILRIGQDVLLICRVAWVGHELVHVVVAKLIRRLAHVARLGRGDDPPRKEVADEEHEREGSRLRRRIRVLRVVRIPLLRAPSGNITGEERILDGLIELLVAFVAVVVVEAARPDLCILLCIPLLVLVLVLLLLLLDPVFVGHSSDGVFRAILIFIVRDYVFWSR
mmetsp:Transcript_16672/g.63403  ORF Transcript_16672/g.63403 Transcript_16672/m.63403 type:complete len:457 (+) Transcript_16672:251-1621(+)